ncbi:hypothetical protein PV08_05342 [Exophiala spinifera]|uniref:DUF1989 domain-containing protein n=1 Tax=Exophiala spinifera TaxID=91928 RepID=A0A0D1ZR60_9EURO|nr:uncharacterized protein PV08_05342 [Exophiala spinifera]KIW15297.1 hypothetical protein PV08_05342 [Exophiala spinifera]
MAPVEIPARTGAYVSLKSGQRLKLINPHGTQVIDFWAFVFPEKQETLTGPDTDTDTKIPTSFTRSSTTAELATTPTPIAPYPFTSGIQYFSASRTRSILSKLVPSATTHDVLYTNKSLPLFTLVEDTTSGIHDTLFGCCDRFRMHNLGHPDYDHGSCAENMHLALARAAEDGCFVPGSVSTEWTPDPLNVFMNVPVLSGLDRESGGGRIECVPPQSKAGEYLVLRAERDVVAVMSACPNDLIKGVNAGQCVGVEYEVLLDL